MSANSSIEWTDATWNPVRGCRKVSPGCKNCYAETFAERWRGIPGHPYEQGFDLRIVEDKLTDPLHWKKPRRVFVNSMSDLFHEGVPFDYIDRVFAVMALTPQHTYQVLTKRAERMAEYLNRFGVGLKLGGAIRDIVGRTKLSVHFTGRTEEVMDSWDTNSGVLPNVWLGTSVENQEYADKRIPHLLRCPAAVRFLSVEPLLGPVDICSRLNGVLSDTPERLHWIIVGGESGPGARPCNVQWIRDIVQQCKAAGVPCFVKQLGAKICNSSETQGPWPVDGDTFRMDDPKGGDPSEWPEDLRVREFPEVPTDGK